MAVLCVSRGGEPYLWPLIIVMFVVVFGFVVGH